MPHTASAVHSVKGCPVTTAQASLREEISSAIWKSFRTPVLPTEGRAALRKMPEAGRLHSYDVGNALFVHEHVCLSVEDLFHVGDPAAIGIADIGKPDLGDAQEIKPGEVPVFWACGVTPQRTVVGARPPICITHTPGSMLVTDIPSHRVA